MAMMVVVRGGGDLASGVILRLYRAGLRVAVTEIPQPLAVRRTVSFAEAIYAGEVTVEEVTGRKVADPGDTLRILNVFTKGKIPILVDPDGLSIRMLHPNVVIDARMTKRPPEPNLLYSADLVIGLGPGFVAGQDCHAVIETNRGHNLGRVIWQGSAEPDTGIPGKVNEYTNQRVLRAPVDGLLETRVEICDQVETGQIIATVGGEEINAPFNGVLRGLLHTGLEVHQGDKIGDIDPRIDRAICSLVSEKSLAIGGGVLEAILSRPELRPKLWA